MDELRESIERGNVFHLLACPRLFTHGSVEQASWLYNQVKKGKDVELTAQGFEQWRVPKTAEEKKKIKDQHEQCGEPSWRGLKWRSPGTRSLTSLGPVLGTRLKVPLLVIISGLSGVI